MGCWFGKPGLDYLASLGGSRSRGIFIDEKTQGEQTLETDLPVIDVSLVGIVHREQLLHDPRHPNHCQLYVS